MADEHQIDARVLTPEGEVYEGGLFQVSARTAGGEVGIRARHAPMLARLLPAELRLYETQQDFSSGNPTTYVASAGWLEVFANNVNVLIEEAHDPADLDQGELRERISDAEQRIADSEEGSAAQETAQADLERAQAFLKAAGGE